MGNNALHLLLNHAGKDLYDYVDQVQFILETVFFQSNTKTSKRGTAALNQQNCDGNTPLHVALEIKDQEERVADIAN